MRRTAPRPDGNQLRSENDQFRMKLVTLRKPLALSAVEGAVEWVY